MDNGKKNILMYIVIGLAVVIIALLIAILIVLAKGNMQPTGLDSTTATDVMESIEESGQPGGSDASGEATGNTETSTGNTEHIHQWQETVTAATCKQGGYTTFTCSCGESYISEDTKPVDHSWKDATCATPKMCSACGIIDGRAKGHSWNNGEVVKGATEEADGEKRFTCTACGEVKIQAIPSKNHAHSYNDVAVTQPTCTEDGYTTHTCLCGDSYQDSHVPASGHNWKDATCTAPKTCIDCGRTEGSAIAHSYESVVTEPTETAQGYTTYTCTVCSDSYRDNYTDPVVYYEAGTLVLQGDGTACLYGQENEILKTYTGWQKEAYYSASAVPWYSDSESILYVVIEGGMRVPDYHTSIWFTGCSNLISVNIPSSLTEIGYQMFYKCTSLKNIYFAEGSCLKEIGGYAFAYCTSLTSLEIPAGVTSVGNGTFSGCTSLTSVVFDENCALSILNENMFYECSKLTDFSIPNTVTEIGRRAFAYCTSLKEIEIPACAKKIGDKAFYQCTGLVNVINTDGNVPLDIGDEAFYECAGLVDMQFSARVHSIGEKAFFGCVSLTNVTFTSQDDLREIGDGAFRNCSALENINITHAVDIIGAHAFFNCTSLTSIEIPVMLLSIGVSTFANCTNLKSVEFPEDAYRLHTIEAMAFYNCSSLTSFEFPDNVADIYENAFAYCTSMTSVTFGADSELSNLKDSAFQNCTGLTEIRIPSGVSVINRGVFYNCTSMTAVYLPNSVKTIHDKAFGNCTQLTSINYGGTKSGWNYVVKYQGWSDNVPATYVMCNDGSAYI